MTGGAADDPGETRLEWVDRLTAEQVHAIRRVVDAVTDVDGVAPLSEHVLLGLHPGAVAGGRHLLLTAGAAVVGYAHLDEPDANSGDAGGELNAELALDPSRRTSTDGKRLVTELAAVAGDRLRLWARGARSGTVALARGLGYVEERTLLQLRRSLTDPVPAPAWPSGVTVRTFVAGEDEAQWLQVNRRAFAHHPDQSRVTMADLEVREHEPWFDPAGFFLAEANGRIVGFHWTKIHAARGAAGEPIGEVYVLGVDPSMQGRRLGPALTLHGLAYLRDRGLRQSMLYADESNRGAVAMYERLGFSRWDTDIRFRPPIAG